MIPKFARFAAVALAMFASACLAGPPATHTSALNAAAAPRVFEIRTYTTFPGKLDDLNQRFRNHTMRIFARHGMTNIGYWTPQDAPLSENTVIYILAHESREAAKRNWAAFGSDPEWQKVRAASEANGRIVSKVESVFVNATDYSPIK